MLTTSAKYLLLVFLYLWRLLLALVRSIYWFVLQRTSRISRLAYQLEQLNAREEELSGELERLNNLIAAIMAHRSSVALERAKVLDQLAETTALKGARSSSSSSTTVRAVPVVSSVDQTAKEAIAAAAKVAEKKAAKPRLSSLKVEKKNCSTPSTSTGAHLQRSASLIVGGRDSPSLITRPISPFLAAKALIFERPRTPVFESQFTGFKSQCSRRPQSPTITVEPSKRAEKRQVEEKVVSSASAGAASSAVVEQTNSSFSKLVGFNLATHRVNEYIDLIVDSTITEFRNCDREATSTSSKRGERFRATIQELYGDPEWRPFINDLRRQYKIFCYL